MAWLFTDANKAIISLSDSDARLGPDTPRTGGRRLRLRLTLIRRRSRKARRVRIVARLGSSPGPRAAEAVASSRPRRNGARHACLCGYLGPRENIPGACAGIGTGRFGPRLCFWPDAGCVSVCGSHKRRTRPWLASGAGYQWERERGVQAPTAEHGNGRQRLRPVPQRVRIGA